MMIRNRILCILFVALGAGIAHAAPSHFIDLHFLHPIATSPDPETDTTVRLSLLWAQSHEVKALDLGFVATGTSGDMKGLQWSTAYAGVGGDLRGVGASLGLHRVAGDVRGIQYSFLAGWTDGDIGGVQFTSVFGYAGQGVRGAQLSGLMNVNDGDGRWVQLSGAVNVTVGNFTGWQGAAFVNHVNQELSGAQTGVLNVADSARGFQLGVINLARDFSGLQLGVVNAARTMNGVPIGLVNLTDDNPRDWLFYASNVMYGNLGFRTEVNGWVSTIVAGFGEAGAVRESAGALGWHFGHRLKGDAKRNLAVDLGFLHVMPNIPENNEDPRIANHPVVQLRLTADWALSRVVSLYGVVGLSSAAESYDDGAESEGKGLVAGGVVLR